MCVYARILIPDAAYVNVKNWPGILCQGKCDEFGPSTNGLLTVQAYCYFTENFGMLRIRTFNSSGCSK